MGALVSCRILRIIPARVLSTDPLARQDTGGTLARTREKMRALGGEGGEGGGTCDKCRNNDG